MDEKKTLVVGSLRHDHATAVLWPNLTSVNVLDFDTVVLFLPSLDSKTISNIGRQTLFELQHTFSHFLKSDGELVVLGAPPLSNDANEDAQWLWCPVPIVSLAQKGDTIEKISDDFDGLLSRLKSWDCVYRLHPNNPGQVLAMILSQGLAQLAFEYRPYALNRAKGILAAQYTYYTPIRGERHDWPGSVTVLPHFPNDEPHLIVATTLVDLLGKPQSESAPDWLSSISMASVSPIDARLARLRQEIATLGTQVEQQLAEKAKMERFKRLLHVSSFELEELVAECLTLLGATIKPARYSQEEFVMEVDDAVFLAECKGVSKSISLQHLRQVQDYVLKYEEDELTPGKGILFGNAWRDLPPCERDTKDKPVFPANVIERAKQFGVSLVSTIDLFQAFSRFLNHEVSAAAILTRITSANGIADLSDFDIG
ncbi:hypothetical protein [Burkholderia sp. L27(2015)]|uniref:hypothetical protein n=1 Tax=Burkholderia sp. L27(2015) TaxID=1641858 RepID=UPI00131C8525|nr:hypothetical protein [Burkholderia sp. L27(2015)]